MEYTVSSSILDSLEEVIYDSNLELLELVHEKFLSDLDFSELKNILDGIKKKKFKTVKNIPHETLNKIENNI
jgi:predicted transcriptional regulator